MPCGCRSPPGEPNGMRSCPLRIAIAGLGVSLGRLPGAATEVWLGSPHDCEPRDDGQSPNPGMTGLSHDTSLGVAEKALPCESTTQTYEVSPGSPGSPTATDGLAAWPATWPATTPAGGISPKARSSRIVFSRSCA